jgi:hypothetical protein
MPEALAILAVLVVSGVVYVGARRQPRDAVGEEAEVSRLRSQVAWLEHRLATARREQWDDEMSGRIAAEHTAASDQLARVSARAPTS